MLGSLVATSSILVHAAPSPGVSGAHNAFGFPIWYEDANGTRLEPCLDVTDTLHCVILPNPGVFDPLQPMSLPSNFPDEFFYSVVDSDKLTTPGCPGAASPLAANPGKAFVRLALEGAFVNGLPALNEQMAFGRIRVVVRGGLCPDHDYSFTHPYGQVTLHTDSDGSIKPVAGTEDIGCVPVAPQTCNFAQATGSRVLSTGFLRWDPAVNPPADPGYLGGDAAVLHPIVGGVNSVFTVTDPGVGDVVTTNLFTVSGKLAGPLVAGSALTDFGGHNVGAAANANIAITNVDATPVQITGLTTDNLAEFTVTGGDCGGATLAQDATCTAQVTFSPTGTGLRQANLVVTHNGLRSPFSVALQGTGTNPGNEPLLTVSVADGSNPPQLNFGSVRIGTESAAQTVTVTNTGTAPLQVTNLEFINTPASFDSQDRAAFRVTDNLCAGVFVPATGAVTCTFGVAFQPLHTHNYAAALKVSANTAGGPVEVALQATGIGGVAAVSTGPDGAGPDGIDSSTGFPTWYQDEAGARVGECLDPNDPLCIVLPDDFYVGGPLQGAPTFANFPSEFFYFVSDSDIIDTPGCGASAPGKAFIRMAQEAAFGGATGGPVDGEQIVFGRIRIVVTSGLCANTTYTFTHPYGQVNIQTDAAGGIRRNAATTDIGCFPVAPDLCNFAQALASPVSGGFLRQVGAPAGYLGDPNVLAPITGSPFIAPGDVAPANYFRINQGANVIGETTDFTVMGKLVGPLMADPPSVNFGTVALDTDSIEHTVTYTNDGQNPLVINSMALVGPTGLPATDYVITNDGCSGQQLDPTATGDSCQVRLRFHPLGNGTRPASLVANHTGLNNPLKVALTGIGGAAAGEPAISVNPPAAAYPDLHVNQVSAAESIRVSNLGGTAPLIINGLDISGPGAGQFTVTANGCLAPVDPNDECAIDVAFAPLVSGDHSAALNIHSNVAALPTVSVALTGRGSNGVPATSGAVNSAGFSTWYQDNNGVRLEPCYNPGNPQDANCVVLADASYNPANPMAFPGNFPSEFFYSLVDSEPVTIPGGQLCGAAGGGGGGTAQLRIALEGAFATGAPLAGQQITFARVRILADGLCNNSTYQFVHPYGTTNLTTDGTGRVRSTVDVPNVVQDTLLGNGFLRWDPNASPAAPAGYLGDARTFHNVVGSTYRPGGPGTDPVNEFRIVGGSLNNVRTRQFLVSGRIAGPVVTDHTALSFAPQVVDTVSANQTVTVTNISPSAIGTLAAATVGPDAADFVVNGGTCTPATSLALDTSCTFTLAFAPHTVGAKVADLQVSYDGLRSPVTVALSGTATPGGHPEINVSPASIAFGNQNVGVPSAPRTITVTNSGTAPLTITSLVRSGVGATSFSTVNNCPAALDPGPVGCTITVTFNPTTSGATSAALTIGSDDPVRPSVTVALGGTGIAPIMTLSANSLSFSTGAGGSSTKTIDVTNTGTATMNLVGAPAISFGPQTVTNPVGAAALKFSATHNCNNVAPGGKCRISVTFAPGAGPVNQNFAVTMTVNSNASNSPRTISLTGQRK